MTTITRYKSPMTRLWPWGEFDQLRRTMRDMFQEETLPVTFDGFAFSPALEVVEKDDALYLTAELAGLLPEDVHVEVENNILTLKGEKKEKFEKKDARYHIWERSYGSFERSIPLPRTVDAEHIDAKFDNGVLEVKLPKVPAAKGRKITIKTR